MGFRNDSPLPPPGAPGYNDPSVDITFLRASVFEVPSSHRVGAIVHGGTQDLQLWPGPGQDRDLSHSYGEGLKGVLQKERERLTSGVLEPGASLRLHPGRLHCDFLLWLAVREPEPGRERSSAPPPKLIVQSVQQALAFAAQRHVQRIALGALGTGAGELDPVDRLVHVVQAARAFEASCFEAGRATGVEEVIVCEANAQVLQSAKRKSGAATAATLSKQQVPREDERSRPRKVTRAAKPKKSRGPSLSSEEVLHIRRNAEPYDRTLTYPAGALMVHPNFGAGKVQTVHPGGAIDVLFETGDIKRLIHAR